VLLFLAAVLNYVDKNTLALLAPTLKTQLGMTDDNFRDVLNAFQVAYTVALLGSGWIVDRLGARLSLALFVGWWSVANVLTAAARSTGTLGLFRTLLGLGEAGNWTASPKAVSDWFPPAERGLAIGIYTAGTPLGMTLAPIVVIGLSERFGWQSAFVITGLAGLVWLVPWWLVARPPREPQASIAPSLAPATSASIDEPGWTWLSAFTRPEVWCLLVARMLSDPVYLFYQNWYPNYLVGARGLTQADVKITWVMYLAAGVGSLVGGWAAGCLIARGWLPQRARAAIMLLCVACMPLSPMVDLAGSVNASVAIASIIVFAHLAWLTNIGALVVDVVPKASVGTVFGIVAAGSSLGTIGMNYLVAALLRPDPATHLIAPRAYLAWYIVAAGLHLAAVPLVLWTALRRTHHAS